jgi:hypothetical protein
LGYAFDFFLAAQRAFIIADNFFRMAVRLSLWLGFEGHIPVFPVITCCFPKGSVG